MTGASRRRAALGAIAAFLLASAVVTACTDVATGPGGVVSIALDSLPMPSVVAGDTLRDVNGAVTPLRAHAFDVRGDTIPDAPVRYVYIPNDTSAASRNLLQVDSITGIVVAAPDARPNAQGRVAARVGNLPTPTAQITVVPRPDSARAADAAGTDTLRYRAGDSTATSGNVLRVQVLHDSTPAPFPVGSYAVTYTVQYAGPSVADSVRLSGDGTHPSTLAFTGSDGVAGRRLRVYAKRQVATADSVVVQARVTYRGVDVRGSPFVMSVQLVPAAAP